MLKYALRMERKLDDSTEFVFQSSNGKDLIDPSKMCIKRLYWRSYCELLTYINPEDVLQRGTKSCPFSEPSQSTIYDTIEITNWPNGRHFFFL